MKKIAVIGSRGQLGQYLCDQLKKYAEQFFVVELSRDELDLENVDQISNVLSEYLPDIVINSSAYTAVDKAESEPDLANIINNQASEAIAKFCASHLIPFIHFSTDYVFAGDADTPYEENDPTNPQGEYGKSKLAGENAVMQTGAQAYIFRTAWVYSQRGANFFKTMLRLAESKSELNIVDDQLGAPTYAANIAEATIKITQDLLSGQQFPPGIYHMTSSGIASWAEFARQIFDECEITIQVNGISTSEYPTPAKRPAYSVLSNQKLKSVFNIELPSWQESLNQCVNELSSDA